MRYLAEDAPSGYGDAADRLVRALRNAGIRIDYRAWNGDSRPPGVARHCRDPRPRDHAPGDVPTIVHLVPEHYPDVGTALPDSPLIAHTVWETDQLPDHWPALLNPMRRVIVPTAWNRAVFEASGIEAPVAVVPHVVCDPTPGDRGMPLGLPDDVVVFYTIARWDQRKAPAMVIQAFLEAFTADDPVALVVKTSARAQYPPPAGWGERSPLLGTTLLEITRVARHYPHPPLIRAEVDDWGPARIAGLHHRGDCYVSLSHGEGWGLGAFDAAAFGNPVVMTGWGGPLAFLDPDAAFLVEYDLEPVQHFLPQSYGPAQRWAVPRLDHAVALLREVAADVHAARQRAAPLRDTVLHDFAEPRVAAIFLDAVPEVTLDAAGRHSHETAGFEPGQADPTAALFDRADTPETTARRRSSDGEELLLVGVTAGPWQSAFDNWVEMAERFRYRYELLGVGVDYVAHATKLELLAGFFGDLPRDRLVFYLDAADAFVCDDASQTLARYRSYQRPLVMSAMDVPGRSLAFDVPDRQWRWANSGGYAGEAGIAADALRGGYELLDNHRRVSDETAMTRYLRLPEHRALATVDYRCTILHNVRATPYREALARHRLMLAHGAVHMCTSSVHFFGGNGRGYNAFAELYGLTPQELAPTGAFRKSAPSAS